MVGARVGPESPLRLGCEEYPILRSAAPISRSFTRFWNLVRDLRGTVRLASDDILDQLHLFIDLNLQRQAWTCPAERDRVRGAADCSASSLSSVSISSSSASHGRFLSQRSLSFYQGYSLPMPSECDWARSKASGLTWPPLPSERGWSRASGASGLRGQP